MSDTVTVAEQDAEIRLDRWFKRHYPALGHGHLEKLLRTGQVRVDGKKAKSGDRVSPGMAIRVPPLNESSSDPEKPRGRPQDEALLRDLIIHRDEHAIVLNKPAGLAVQGGSNTTRHVDGVLDGRVSSTASTRILAACC
jgi:23S rRNA pseudouridine955/2504/2580 synthase